MLLERLQGRFGRAAVYGLRAVAEHRPEKAWAKSPASGATDGDRMPGVAMRCAQLAESIAGSAAVMAAAEARGASRRAGFARALFGPRTNRKRLVGRAGRRSRLLHGQERPRPEAVGISRSPNSFLVFARAVRLTRAWMHAVEQCGSNAERGQPCIPPTARTAFMPSCTASAISRSCAGLRIQASS